jgi:hypothetical protein
VSYYDSKGSAYYIVTSTYEVAGVPTRAPQSARTIRRSSAFCGSTGYVDSGYSWSFGSLHWVFVSGSAPGNLDLNLTETNMRNAHIEWENNQNWCSDIGDASAANFTYDGRLNTNWGQNGVNSVGFGDVDPLPNCGSSAVACTGRWVSGSTITETDTRLDTTGRSWANNGAAGYFDVWHVLAHEIGHQIGFEHYGDGSVVMYGGVSSGDTSNRKLGRGDALGNNAKY